MHKLRFQLVILIGSIAMFIGLILLDPEVISGFQFHPSIYIGLCILILIEMVLPARLFTPLYNGIFVLTTIVLAWLFLLGTGSQSSAENVFGLMIELGFSAWLLVLVRTISNTIRTYETADKISRLIGIEDPSFDIQTAMPRIRADITRSRHYERPLSVIVLDSSDGHNPDVIAKMEPSILKWISKQVANARLAETIRKELRVMDMVLKDPAEQKLILVCPEISAENIQEVTRHLESVIQREFGYRPKYASASFPNDGISFDGLRQKATNNLNKMTEESEDNKPIKARQQLGAE